MIMKEIFKNVKGYEGIYKVSNLGRIKGKNGLRKIWKSKIGYCFITLSNNGKTTTHLVHRLVAQAFIINTKNKPEVNHKNGIKSDNNAENLEYVTHSRNMAHAKENNLMKPYDRSGENHMSNKLNEKQVRIIKHLFCTIKTKMTQMQVAKIFKISQPTILDILKGRSWKHIII